MYMQADLAKILRREDGLSIQIRDQTELAALVIRPFACRPNL